MASGGPGDHWATDLFTWGRPAFGEPCDSLIKEIARYGGDKLLHDDAELGRRLCVLWPRRARRDRRALTQLAEELTVLRDRLRTEAKERGWELD